MNLKRNRSKNINPKMELTTLFKAIMLLMSNSKPESPLVNEPNNFSDSGSITNTLATSLPPIESIEVQSIDASDQKNDSNESTTESSRALMPYDFDCSMPYPPSVLAENSWEEISQPEIEIPHAKATFSIPIHIVHKCPDSAINNLHRYTLIFFFFYLLCFTVSKYLRRMEFCFHFFKLRFRIDFHIHN